MTRGDAGRADRVLAVDGGNSKADVALVAADGTLLGAVRGPTISHQAVAAGARARARLAALVAAAARRRRGADGQPPDRSRSTALAGADYPSDVRLLERAFGADRRRPRETLVLNDTFAALRAGATRPWGIALICGQGINARGGRPRRAARPVRRGRRHLGRLGRRRARSGWPGSARRSGRATGAARAPISSERSRRRSGWPGPRR